MTCFSSPCRTQTATAVNLQISNFSPSNLQFFNPSPATGSLSPADMDRQRSFSIKTSRILVFSVAISSSLFFLAVFSIWVTRISPTIQKETRFQFKNPTLGLGVEPLTFTSSSTTELTASEAQNLVFIDTHLNRPENTSGFANFSRFDELRVKKSEAEVPADEEEDEDEDADADADEDEEEVPGSDLTGPAANSSANGGGSSNSVSNSEDLVSDGTVHERDNGNSGGYDSVNGTFPSEQQLGLNSSSDRAEFVNNEKIEEKKSSGLCDVTKGRWVFDESLPLYTNDSCPFIDEGFNCQGNGRLDRGYMKWRWQPYDCDIQRFNATRMLESMRGKRLVFVGDSINRNQWESMLCLLMGAVKDPKKVFETRGRKITKEKGNYSFKFVDYECTVEYYVTHFLVHETKARLGKRRVQTLRIDAINRGSSRWRGADILVFNTAHWWNHHKTKAGINYYQEAGVVHPQLEASTAFRRALMTWAHWVDRHINPVKTQVFFRSSAPSHFSGGQWNSGGHCKEATQPFNGTLSSRYPEKNAIAGDVIRKMRVPVTFLNITRMSDYRVDAHPSVHGRKFGKIYSANVQDCSHWCLPGVPDTWNELLYFHLESRRRGIS